VDNSAPDPSLAGLLLGTGNSFVKPLNDCMEADGLRSVL